MISGHLSACAYLHVVVGLFHPPRVEEVALVVLEVQLLVSRHLPAGEELVGAMDLGQLTPAGLWLFLTLLDVVLPIPLLVELCQTERTLEHCVLVEPAPVLPQGALRG